MRFREQDANDAEASPDLVTIDKTVRLPPRRAREAGSLYGKAHLVTDTDGVIRTLDASATYLCDSDHVLSESRYIAAVCAIGGEWMCTEDGCATDCTRCGRPVCREHRVVLPIGPEVEVCMRCSFPFTLRQLFGVGR